MENVVLKLGEIANLPALAWLGTPLVWAIFILVLGWLVAGFVRRTINRINLPGASEAATRTVRPVLAAVCSYIIILCSIYAALTKLGIPTGGLLAAFGGAALAIGLALQSTLSNIASGVMLLVLHPIRVGEYIETPVSNGTVLRIGLFSTTLKNIEGVTIYVPNSEIWKARIQNFARHETRRLFVDIGVGYDTDLPQAQTLLVAAMSENPHVDKNLLPPECFVTSFGESAINLSCRCWLPATEWAKNTSDIRIALKQALDQANIEMPLPQRVVTHKNN
jgi:small conductance mechanosensitive channel